MGLLVETFVAHGGTHPAESDADVLEAALAALCARGRGSNATLAVDDATFVAHLARCGAPIRDDAESIFAKDLFLACACLCGDKEAVARLRAESRPVLRRYLSRVRGAHAILDEIEQRLWDAAIVGEPPRLSMYSGRGPLGAWIGISAQRLALMTVRHEDAEMRARRESAIYDRLADTDPELAVIKGRFRSEFQAAVAAGLETLDDRGKMLYRMHLLDGMTYERIAETYKVHPVTVRRWLDAAGEKVLDRAKEELRKTHPLSSVEFDSLAHLLVRDLDISITGALKLR